MAETTTVSKPSTPREWATAVVIVLVPIFTTCIAGKYADISARRAADVRLIELAAGILRERPAPTTIDLRTWAMDILDHYSEVKLPSGLRQSLIDSLSLPAVSFSAAGGSISAGGVFTAGEEPGRYPLVSCAQAGTICDTSWINIVRPPDEARNRR